MPKSRCKEGSVVGRVRVRVRVRGVVGGVSEGLRVMAQGVRERLEGEGKGD